MPVPAAVGAAAIRERVVAAAAALRREAHRLSPAAGADSDWRKSASSAGHRRASRVRGRGAMSPSARGLGAAYKCSDRLRARGRDIQQSDLLVPGATRHQALQIRADLSRLLVADHGRRRHDEIAALLPARQVEPAQQRLAPAVEIAIEPGHQHMIEFEALGAVDGQDLHRPGRARPRLRVQVRQHRVQCDDAAPLPGCGALAQRVEESARVTQLRGRIGVRGAECDPDSLQPVGERHAITLRHSLLQRLPHPLQPRALLRRTLLQALRLAPAPDRRSRESPREESALRVASDAPHHGARSTASHAVRSPRWQSARVSATRSRTTGTSPSGTSSTPIASMSPP